MKKLHFQLLTKTEPKSVAMLLRFITFKSEELDLQFMRAK